MDWTFRPPLWSIFGTAAGCALLMTAGFWQISRGEQKQQLLAQYDAAQHAAPLRLNSASAALARAQPQAAQVAGEYVAEHQLLLDGQVLNGRVGYDVWTPLKLADGALLIVNRGWIQQTGARSDLPTMPAPAGTIELRGLWRVLPEPAMRLGHGDCESTSNAAMKTWPRLVEYPTIEDLNCIYGGRVVAGELLLSPDAPGGFARDWRALPAEMPPGRHYGYAAQWFAFAATLFGFFIRLNFKRKS
jgi:cytochrome oxidase assembly protein ShyY1